MLDDDSLIGARELQRVPPGLGSGEIDRNSRRAGESLQRLREIFSADGGRRLRARFQSGKVRLRRRYLANDRIELQLAQQIGGQLLVDALPREFVGRELERHVGLDAHQSSREVDRRAMLGEQARDFFRAANPGLLDTVEVLVEFLDAAEFLNQRRRRSSRRRPAHP